MCICDIGVINSMVMLQSEYFVIFIFHNIQKMVMRTLVSHVFITNISTRFIYTTLTLSNTNIMV